MSIELKCHDEIHLKDGRMFILEEQGKNGELHCFDGNQGDVIQATCYNEPIGVVTFTMDDVKTIERWISYKNKKGIIYSIEIPPSEWENSRFTFEKIAEPYIGTLVLSYFEVYHLKGVAEDDYDFYWVFEKSGKERWHSVCGSNWIPLKDRLEPKEYSNLVRVWNLNNINKIK
jgi:hypothetical protein